MTLSDVADINPKGPAVSSTEEVSFVPMSAFSDITASVEREEVRHYQEVKKGYTAFRNDDVLLAKITHCFDNGKIGQALTQHEFGFGSTEFHAIRPKAGKADGRFLHHFLRSPRVREHGIKRMTGSAGQRRVPTSYLESLEVPNLPLHEQRRVAAILDKGEELRAKRRAALTLLDHLPQAIFLDMFGDPATNPCHWPIVSLSSLLRSKPHYGTMIPGEKGTAEWLVLRVANIQDCQLDLTDLKYVDLPASAVERHSIADGDVLLARAIASQDHLGKAVVVHPGNSRWAFDSHLMRLRFERSQAAPEYVTTLLKTDGGRSLFLAVTRRSAVQFNINTKEIMSLKIPTPPIELQRVFAARVEAIHREQAAHQYALTGLDALPASLQEDLLRSRYSAESAHRSAEEPSLV